MPLEQKRRSIRPSAMSLFAADDQQIAPPTHRCRRFIGRSSVTSMLIGNRHFGFREASRSVATMARCLATQRASVGRSWLRQGSRHARSNVEGETDSGRSSQRRHRSDHPAVVVHGRGVFRVRGSPAGSLDLREPLVRRRESRPKVPSTQGPRRRQKDRDKRSPPTCASAPGALTMLRWG